MRKHTGADAHPLEVEFGLPAREILDAIKDRPRCKMNVRGAVAEHHLGKYLQRLLQRGDIDNYQPLFSDQEPDYRVTFKGKHYLIECKNVEVAKWTPEDQLQKPRASGVTEPIKIDFKKTRTQNAASEDPAARSQGVQGRNYERGKFSVLAACLARRSGNWEFRFIGVQNLKPHEVHSDRLSDKVQVDITVEDLWKSNLTDALEDPSTLSFAAKTSVVETSLSASDTLTGPLSNEA